MKLDVLDTFPTLKICTAYRLGEQILDAPPANVSQMALCEPVYEEWPGWRTSTSNATSWEELPERAWRYLARIEELLETPIARVSVGAGRGQTITRDDLLR
jgi:adenylosuccinate synthase